MFPSLAPFSISVLWLYNHYRSVQLDGIVKIIQAISQDAYISSVNRTPSQCIWELSNWKWGCVFMDFFPWRRVLALSHRRVKTDSIGMSFALFLTTFYVLLISNICPFNLPSTPQLNKPPLPFTLSPILVIFLDLHSFRYERKRLSVNFNKTIWETGKRVAHRCFFLVAFVSISWCCNKVPITLCLKTTHMYYLMHLEIRSSIINMCLFQRI